MAQLSRTPSFGMFDVFRRRGVTPWWRKWLLKGMAVGAAANAAVTPMCTVFVMSAPRDNGMGTGVHSWRLYVT